MAAETIQVDIDGPSCQATQNCVRVAPHLFELRDGVSAFKPAVAAEGDLPLLLEAEEGCPLSAISVLVMNGSPSA